MICYNMIFDQIAFDPLWFHHITDGEFDVNFFLMSISCFIDLLGFPKQTADNLQNIFFMMALDEFLWLWLLQSEFFGLLVKFTFSLMGFGLCCGKYK